MAETEAEKKVSEEKARADAARADAEKRMDEKFDLLLKGVDSLRSDLCEANKRMDSFDEERKRKDAAEEERKKADKARRDAGGDDGITEDPEEAKARELAADKARRAFEFAQLQFQAGTTNVLTMLNTETAL